MSWIKLDINFLENFKIDALSSEAKLLYIWGLCYSGRQMSDGFVPVTRVSTIEHQPLVQELLDRRLWQIQSVDGVSGYEIHDYLRYQTDKAKIEEVREKNRVKLALWRESKREAEIAGLRVTKGVTELQTKGVTELQTKGVTTPEEEIDNDPEIDSQFEKFWSIYPRSENMKLAERAFTAALKVTSFEAIMDGVERLIDSKPDLVYVPFPAKWLGDERWTDKPVSHFDEPEEPTPVPPKMGPADDLGPAVLPDDNAEVQRLKELWKHGPSSEVAT